MKNIIFFALAVLTTTIFSSCFEDMKPVEYKVTVLWETSTPILLQPLRAFKTLTESGDTVEAVVREDVVLNNKLPYKAIMSKKVTDHYGYIEKAVSEEKK